MVRRRKATIWVTSLALATAFASGVAGAPSASAATAPHPVCSGTPVTPGTDVQAVINMSPGGTTFCFTPGTYVLTRYVRPKSFDRLISTVPHRAILTGLGIHNAGIAGSGGPAGQHDVLIEGFVIRRFANTWVSFPRSALQAGSDWTIRDNDISYNAQSGVTVNSGTQLVGNLIHHNGRYGFGGGPLAGLLVENNDVSFNNLAHYDPHNDAGGSKIIRSTGVVFRGNWVHDNYGNGLWCDWENQLITYENNTIERNYLAGIFHEASGAAVIRNNTFNNNGKYAVGHSIWWSADLLLNDSKDTEIYGNRISAGANGIALIDIDRSTNTNSLGRLEIRNVYVHDNMITLPAGGQSGMVRSRKALAPNARNRATRNSLRFVNGAPTFWIWPRWPA